MTLKSNRVLDPEWDNAVIYCGGTPWDGVRGTDRHIAERLRRYAPVLYVDPPQSVVTWARHGKRHNRLERLSPGLARLQPTVLPGFTRPGIRITTERLTCRAIDRAVHELGATVHATVVASELNLLAAGSPRHRVVYATDDHAAGAQLMGLDSAFVVRREAEKAAAADRVIVSSPGLVDKWRAMGHDPVVVPNGCDPAAYADTGAAGQISSLPLALPKPVAVFSGHVSARIDLALLEVVADRGVSVLLVGPRSTTFEPERVDRLLARPNVLAVGGQPFEAVPAYLRQADVGITPYARDAFNEASFPLKTLEYLAAGLPVVATGLPATRWLDTDLVRIADQPAAFADAVVAAAAEAHDPERIAARHAFAETHSWDRRVAEVAAAIGCGTAVREPVAEPVAP